MIALADCGHAQAPDSATEARQLQEQRIVQIQQMRRHREVAAYDEAYRRAEEKKRRDRELERPGCEEAVDDTSTAEERRRKCESWLAEETEERRARWQTSGVACFDHRTSDRLVEVSCDVPVRPDGATSFMVAFEKSVQLAAYAALSSGLTNTIVVGKDRLRGRLSTSTTPVECEAESPGVFGLRVYAWALLGGDSIRTECSSAGVNMSCTTNPGVPAPTPGVHCRGGESIASITSWHMMTQYEALSADEAARRDSPLLPLDRRPLAAASIARRFDGLR